MLCCQSRSGMCLTYKAFLCMSLQAVEKLVLAEGSKMAVAAFQDAQAQGVYGLVQGLGSIVVRTVFQPFEEAAFLTFSKGEGRCWCMRRSCKRSSSRALRNLAGHRVSAAADLQRQAQLLTLLVRCITTVALLAAAFGPAYAYLALLLLYSRRWADTEAPLALGLYSLYLVLVASNGILESFVHSVADERQLHVANATLVVFTAVHAALSIAAVRMLGASGLILADGANMALRIGFCLVFIQRRFGGASLGFHPRNLMPSRQTLLALTVAAAITCVTRVTLLPSSSSLVRALHGRSINLIPTALARLLDEQPFHVLVSVHVAVGVACLGLVATAILHNEGDIVQEFKRLRRTQAL